MYRFPFFLYERFGLYPFIPLLIMRQEFIVIQKETTLQYTIMEQIMDNTTTDNYKGWTITVTPGKNLCAKFSFDITDPEGKSQHVSMGGENSGRALERAKEMIDLEISFLEED